MINLTIPVSPDQEDALVDHVLYGSELGMVPDERAWMMAHVQKAHPGCKIIAADLDLLLAVWVLTLEEPTC